MVNENHRAGASARAFDDDAHAHLPRSDALTTIERRERAVRETMVNVERAKVRRRRRRRGDRGGGNDVEKIVSRDDDVKTSTRASRGRERARCE